MKSVWKHKKIYKDQLFFGSYEFAKGGKRIMRFINIRTGRETKAYTSSFAAKKDGWLRA